MRLIDVDKKTFDRREVVKLLPAIHQSATLQKFFGSTVNHLFQPGQSQAINGYVGQYPNHYRLGDAYVRDTTPERTFYQLEPTAVSIDGTGAADNLLFYPDLVNYLRSHGANVTNHDRLFTQPMFSWCPPIDLDKLLNYRQYYWSKEGPEPREIVPTITLTTDGKSRSFTLPGAWTESHQVIVRLNGETVPTSQYVLTETKITFLITPKKGQTLSLWVHENITPDDIIGKVTFTTSGIITDTGVTPGFKLSSGMKIRLWSYNDGYVMSDYIVEGVGRSINLIRDTSMETMEILPYRRYVADGVQSTYAIPSGEENGILVHVNGREAILGLSYTRSGRDVVFASTYLPAVDDLVEIWLLREINITDIVGQEQYSNDVISLRNGMKINLTGILTGPDAEQYRGEFFVSGVGTSITLTKDTSRWRDLDYRDYLVMERGDVTVNDWSTGNRWFHRDVLGTVRGAEQARRPIIEFAANIELFQYGTIRRKDAQHVISGSVSYVKGGVTYTEVITDFFQQLTGAEAITINGKAVRENDRILVLSDKDDLINNRVYAASRPGNFRFTLDPDGDGEGGEAIVGEIIRLPDHERYWTGLDWAIAQKKSTVNQAPLFNLRDRDGISYNDGELYPNSNFAGNPLFGYQCSVSRPLDKELNLPVVLQTTGKGAEFLFENFLYTADILGYRGVAHPVENGLATPYRNGTEDISGYGHFLDVKTGALDNGWYLNGNSHQMNVITQTGSGTVTVPYPLEPFTILETYVNGLKVDGVQTMDGVVVTVPDNSVIVVKAWGNAPTIIRGFWEIPANLQSNPLNHTVTTLTRGAFYDHFRECLSKQDGFTGVDYAGNNYRDTAKDRSLGTKIVQHSASLLKTMLLASNGDLDIISAIHAAENDYTRMKEKVLNTALTLLHTGALDDGEEASVWLDECLRIVNQGKTSSFPYWNSGMAGMAYIPPTPAYLGVGSITTPEVIVDFTLPTPMPVIVGHDGSITLQYGDIRDKVLLEWENRIHASIDERLMNGSTPAVMTLVSGKYRTSPYSVGEWNEIARPLFERWCSVNGINSRRNDAFDPANVWTWNFSNSKDMDGETLPGHWTAIYRHFFDCVTPHLTPWEMLGYASKPSWWETRYGAAPYTKGNDILWDDVEAGYRHEEGIDPRYARPGVKAILPIDGNGNLLNPIDCGIVDPQTIPQYDHAGKEWSFGDGGSAERVWMRSSSYAFHQAIIQYLLTPNTFIEWGWETATLSRDGQYLTEQGVRSRPDLITLHGVERKIGIQQWIVDAAMARGQDVSAIQATMRGMDVRLAYRIGGFTDVNTLQAVADNFDRVPDEDVTIRLYRSPSIREEHYSGVVIEWTGRGWKVFGYNASNPSFTIIPSDVNGPSTPVKIGDEGPDTPNWKANTYYPRGTVVQHNSALWQSSKSHTSSITFEETYWNSHTVNASPLVLRIADYHRPDVNVGFKTIPYGTEFYTQQDVWDFLISYQRYLESRGWIFDNFSGTGEPETFRQSAMSFLHWSILDFPPGNFIALSPSGTSLHYRVDHGMVQNIEQTVNGQYSILDKEGYPIPISSTNVSRMGDDLRINSIDPTVGMYSCNLTISEIEHVAIFSNWTIFGDLIYDPVLGLRQPRLRIQGHRSQEWKGRMDAPGFIVTDNLLLPNFDKSAESFRDMYEIESYENIPFRENARANIGYTRRSYMDDLLMSGTSQFDFYRGMIRQKGTASAMEKLLRSTHVSGGADVRFMEEWALRAGSYGATAVKQYMEFILPQTQIRTTPQPVIFTDVIGGEVMDNPWDDVISLSADDERWIHKPSEGFVYGESGYRSRTAGPVLVGETKWSFTTTGHFLTAIQAGVTFETGDTAWIYDWNGSFSVMRLTEKTAEVHTPSPGTGTEIGVVVDGSGFLIVEDDALLPDGIYEITPETKETSTYSRSFSYTDAMPTSKSFTALIDLTAHTGDVTETIIPLRDLVDVTMLTTIHLRTLETTGDNFRGKWTKKLLGEAAVIIPADIQNIFGADFSQQGVAFSLLTNGEIFHPTKFGVMTVTLNGTVLTPGTYFLDKTGQWLFISTYVATGSSIQYRAIRDTDILEVEVTANPQISIGTNDNPEKYFRRDNTPDITSPMGIVKEWSLPYWMSLDNGASTLTEDVKVFIYRDGATQGRIQVTIDAIQMIAEGQDQVLELPAGASLDGISINVREAFQTGNLFGNNQLTIGDMSNGERFVGSSNFPASELLTAGEKSITTTALVPYLYPNKEKITVSFRQGWSLDILNRYGFVDVSDTKSFDYLTTPDEWYRALPFTYRPGADLTVRINGSAHSRYDGSPIGDFSDLQWEVTSTPDGKSLLYFGERLQNTVNGSPVRYPVGDDNAIRVFPLPGTPVVDITPGVENADIIPVIGGGTLREITVIDGGTGYQTGYVDVKIIGNGTGATATATVVNGSITAITVLERGANFTSIPYIDIRDTRKIGTGAKAIATLSNDGIQSFIINRAGKYTAAPTITLTPSNGAQVEARLGKGLVSGVTFTKGTDYTFANVTYTSPPVQPASATAYLDGDGRVMLINVTDPGANYHSVPSVVLSGNGSDATAIAVLNDMGGIAAIQITNYGHGYTTAPTVIISGGTISETLPCQMVVIEEEIPAPCTNMDGTTSEDLPCIITHTEIQSVPLPTRAYFSAPHASISGDGIGATVTPIMGERGIAGVKIINTGSSFRRGVTDRDMVEVRLYDGLGYRVLRQQNSMDGYRVVGNMISFMKPPRFGGELEIILHHPVKVGRTEDVDITTPGITFTPATSGELQVDVQYSVVSSKLRYVSDLSGNPLSATAVTDPLTKLISALDGDNVITIKGKMWERIVFQTLNDLMAYSPETPFKTGDLAWVNDTVYRHDGGWNLYRLPGKSMDYRKVNGALIYNTHTNRVEQNLTIWNPMNGYLPGDVDKEIKYRVDYDPALYSGDAWGEEQVGILWWDRSTTYFVDYRIGDLAYKAKYWGQVAPGTEVDIFEWVMSPVPPSEWAEYCSSYKKVMGEWYPSGEAKDQYRKEEKWNPHTGLTEVRYYFWVKNPEATPPVKDRFLSGKAVREGIMNPSALDLPWFAVVDPTTILLSGIVKYLNDRESVLQVNWQTSNTEGNVHRQWVLLREGDERSPVPASLWGKMSDSLVGWDAGQSQWGEYEDDTGTLGEVARLALNQTPVGEANGPNLVPDPTLHWREMVGNEHRPRQTWFTPEWVGDVLRVSSKAREHFRHTLNAILYRDQVNWDIDNSLFPITTPVPSGKKILFSTEKTPRMFVLPRDFKTRHLRVTLKNPQGVVTTIPESGAPLTYSLDKVKIANVYHPRVVLSEEAPRYSEVTIYSGDYHELTASSVQERDELWLAGRVSIGEMVLLTGQAETSGFWTMWKATRSFTDETTIPDGTWELVSAQTYNLADFVSEIDWWDAGYENAVITATFETTAHRNAAIPFPSSSDIVKVLDNGSGKWTVSVWRNGTWVVVGRERQIKQLLPFTGERYAGPGFEWSDLANDLSIIGKRDGSWELKVLLDHLNPILAVGDDGLLDVLQSNELFFSMLYFAHTQNVVVDWAFKTSYLYLGGYNEPITASPIQTADQSTSLISYINEVKPYHVKIRDFVRRLSPDIEWANTYVTDFDKAPVYDANLANNIPGNDKSLAYRPLSVIPNGDGTYTIPDEDYTILSEGYWPQFRTENEGGKQYWRDWLNNSTINPQQPSGVVADASLIRSMKITMKFDRCDDYAGLENGNTSVGYWGWGGGVPSIGWDIPAWDNEQEVSSSSKLSSYNPQPGMWKNDPFTLIPGLNYRGTGIDGYSFQNEELDVILDGGQMDRANLPEPDYRIAVDGGNMTDPYVDGGHPPELIKVRPLDSTAMTVWQNASVGSPLISTYRYTGRKSMTVHGWGPYPVNEELQHNEAIMVLVDGKSVQKDQYRIVDQNLYFVTERDPHALVSITGIGIGGGTPHQSVDYVGDGVTASYAIPSLGQLMENRVHVYREFTNTLAIKDSEWVLRESLYNDVLRAVAYGNGQYLAVGDRIAIRGVQDINGVVVTITSDTPHGLLTGMKVEITKASQKATEGLWDIIVTSPTTFTYMLSTVIVGAPRGTVEGMGQARILSSTDGINWQPVILPVMEHLTGAIFRNEFILWGTGGALVRYDGLNWETGTIHGRDIRTITWMENTNKWVATVVGGMYTSDDLTVWESPIRRVKRTIGIHTELAGVISGKNDTARHLTPELAMTFLARGQVGLSMGAVDPRYVDASGTALDANDDRPYLWQVGNITVLDVGTDGEDSPAAGWSATLTDGTGEAAELTVHVLNGQVTSVVIARPGKYSLVPNQAAFTVKGTALSSLGMTAGRYLGVVGTIDNPSVPDGAKLTINGTNITFRAGSLLDVVAKINKTTGKHRVHASMEGSRLRLDIKTQWEVKSSHTLPAGMRLGVSFRPYGPDLSEGMDSLLQGLDYWENGDLVLLNGQSNEEKNGIYRFERGTAGSNYSFVHPIDGTPGVPLQDRYVYDEDDGVAYSLIDSAYRQFNLDLTDLQYWKGALIGVGDDGVIIRTTDLLDWQVVEGPDRNNDTLLTISASDDLILAVGNNGRIIMSEDGVVWTNIGPVGNLPLTDIACLDGVFTIVGHGGAMTYPGLVAEMIGTKTRPLSAQVVNGKMTLTLLPMKTTTEVQGSIANGTVTLSSVPVVGNMVRVVNSGTVITSHTHHMSNHAITLPLVEVTSKDDFLVTRGGVKSDDWSYTVGTDGITIEMVADPVEEVFVTTFLGGDKCMTTSREVLVDGNVTFVNGPTTYRSGYGVGIVSESASTKPIPDTIIVRLNGLELTPPDSHSYTPDGIHGHFPIVPPVPLDRTIEVTVDGVRQTVGGPADDVMLVYTSEINPADRKIREVVFAVPPARGSELFITVFGRNEYTIYDREILFVNAPQDGDVITIVEFSENTSMGIKTDLFEAVTGDHEYLIENRPYNGNHVFVSINGETKVHMKDYRIDEVIIGGWDTMKWGGDEQFGPWQDKVMTAEYLAYRANGGLPPAWNGVSWVEGLANGAPFATIPWNASQVAYNGPAVYGNPSASDIQGPPALPYGWDVVYEGAMVRFDTPQMSGDLVKVTSMSGQVYRRPFAWKTYRNALNEWEAIRVSDAHKTVLAYDLPITTTDVVNAAEEVENGQRIRLYGNPRIPVGDLPHLILPKPHSGKRGVIWIGDERIEYTDVHYLDDNGNYLMDGDKRYLEITGIVRGTQGTSYGVPKIGDRYRESISGTVLTLRQDYREVTITHQGKVIPWKEDAMAFNKDALWMERNGQTITFSEAITGEVFVDGLVSDARNTTITHKAGSWVTDGSYQQYLTAFQTFDLGVERDLGQSQMKGVTFLQKHPGSRHGGEVN